MAICCILIYQAAIVCLGQIALNCYSDAQTTYIQMSRSMVVWYLPWQISITILMWFFFQSKLLYQSYFLTKFEQTSKKVIFKLFFFSKQPYNFLYQIALSVHLSHFQHLCHYNSKWYIKFCVISGKNARLSLIERKHWHCGLLQGSVLWLELTRWRL